MAGDNDDDNDNSSGDEGDVVVGPLSGNGGNSSSRILNMPYPFNCCKCIC